MKTNLKKKPLLFKKVALGEIKCIYSELTEREISKAPHQVRDFFNNLKSENKERILVTEEALELGQTYVKEKVVGKTSLNDCIHIALATLNKVDILVSWNFKHIVNVYRIRGYNSINLRLGHSQIEIRSPKEIVGNENDN